jgi:hypothetical protein
MLGEQDTRLALLLPVYRYAIHQVGYLQADVEAAGFYDVRRGTIEPPVQGVQRYCSSTGLQPLQIFKGHVDQRANMGPISAQFLDHLPVAFR